MELVLLVAFVLFLGYNTVAHGLLVVGVFLGDGFLSHAAAIADDEFGDPFEKVLTGIRVAFPTVFEHFRTGVALDGGRGNNCRQ